MSRRRRPVVRPVDPGHATLDGPLATATARDRLVDLALETLDAGLGDTAHAAARHLEAIGHDLETAVLRLRGQGRHKSGRKEAGKAHVHEILPQARAAAGRRRVSS